MGREHFKRTLSAPGLATPGYEIRTATISLTPTQFKAIRATPATLVPAPGPGRALQLLSGAIIYDFAAVYTETADNLVARYTNGSGAAASQVIETTGFIDQTIDEIRPILPVNDADIAPNAALVLHNNGDGEFGGTGSPIRIFVEYAVITTGL